MNQLKNISMDAKLIPFLSLILIGLLFIPACAIDTTTAANTNTNVTQLATATVPPTPTATVPPPPQVEYTPVAANVVSPIIVQRLPRRGEELAPAGVIELSFDRAMDETATSAAFTLQAAADQPTEIVGEINWLNAGRTLRFTPSDSLAQASVYDVILTQDAVATDGAPIAEPFTFRFNTPGFLEVAQVIPADGTADVETEPTITVMFNRPVVPLTSLGETEDFPNPVQFEPAVSGSGEWLNTSIYVFTPDEPLPGGVTFTARVTGGLTDVTGNSTLANDTTWQFTTQPPEVVFTDPNDGQTLIPIENAIHVTFNQPIDPQSAQDNFTVIKPGLLGASAIEGDFLVQAQTLTFTPTARLDFDTTYQVEIASGVTSVAGGEGMRSAYNFSFTTVPLPRIVRTEPSDGAVNVWPYTDFRIEFNTPINPNTVMEHITMVPPLPITATDIYTYYSSWDNSFTFDFGAEPSQNYEVKIAPGIEDPYGNKTEDNLTIQFRTAPLDPSYRLRTPDLVATYDAALPAKLFVSHVNVNTLDLRLYQLNPSEIFRPTWEWSDYAPTRDDLIREWEEQLTASDNKQEVSVLDLAEDGGALSPGLYLLEVESPQVPDQYYGNRRHVMVVTESNLTLKVGQRDALVWATDLATGEPLVGQNVIFYDENNQQRGTVATDADGVAQLDMSQRQNRYSMMAVVLPEGEQPFAAVSESWARGINPYEFGLEYAYTLPDYNVHIYTDRPIYRPGQTIYFKGVIRTEDDVSFARPDLGQVHVALYDAAYEIILDENLPVSPNGTFNGEVTLAEGASLGNYNLAIDFEGQYQEQYFQVAAYRPPEFEVVVTPETDELLRGDGIEATIQASYFFGGPLAGADVTWNVLAESYRFEPAQLGSYTFTDSDDPYICYHCWWYPQDNFPETILSGFGTTDENGQVSLSLDGAEIDDLLSRGSHRLTIEATVTGTDNQFISGREQVVVHKGDYYIGLSPQEYVADAGEETAIDLVTVDWASERQSDKTLDIQVVKYTWENTFIDNENGGGYWEYQTRKSLIDQFTVTTDNLGEAVARFTPPEGGSYQVIAQDAATTVEPDIAAADLNELDDTQTLARSPIRSSIFIWVAGEDDVSWRRENHDRLTLISDRVEYAPGETAEILIPSPFVGEHYALVTIERGRIIEQEVIPMTSNSEIYQLPITANQAPNIYVSVVLVQGREGEAAGDLPRLADFKLGILPLDVTPSAQTLDITLTPSLEQGEPGSEVTYDVVATDVEGQPVAAEFSLDLVDKSVLSLQPRQPEAIVKAYYSRRGLGITTASALSISANRFIQELAEDLDLDQAEFAVAQSATESRGIVLESAPVPAAPLEEESLEEFDSALAVADGEAGAARSELAQLPADLEVREEFSDTAYWNPVVVTDASGEAQVTLTLPDNLTTWVMRGVGVTRDTLVGEATVELVSTKPLLIRPVAPRFFVVDDRAELAANVNNNTDTDLSVEVTLAGEGVTLTADASAVQTVDIPARGETKVTWPVTVEDVPDAELVFAAVSTDGDYEDAAKPRLTTGPDGSLLVFRYTTPDIVGTAGQLVQADSRTEAVALPPNFDDRRGQLSLQLDPSLAAGMRDGLDYLEHYEYECTEQTVSRFLPNILTFDALQSLGIENQELEDNLPELVEEGLTKLYLQQKPDGGWGWWATDQSNVHVTAYVVFALTKAAQAEVEVSDTVLANGQNFLLDHLKGTRELNSNFDANRHAFVVYALAEGDRAPIDALEDLFEAREKLSHYARAYLAQALYLTDEQGYQNNINTLLSDINNAAILSATGAHWEEANYDWWAMNTDTRSTAIILDTLAKLDPENELIPNVVRWLMVARRDGIWETTQETAWSLIALTDWMVETGELEANYEYAVFLNDDEQVSGAATKENVQESIKLQVAVADLAAETSNLLTVTRADGNGRLYYSAHLEVYQPVDEVEPAERGVIVSRQYRSESCLAAQAQDSEVVCEEVTEAQLGEVIRVDLTIIAPNDLYYVVVEDALPAGAEAIDTGLATTSLLAMDPTLSRTSRSAGSDEYGYYWWWWQWYSRSELRDEKVVLFADYLPKGTYEYSYTMRATLPGDYHVLPTVAQEFYFPEVFGRSDGRLLQIRDGGE